MAAQQSGTCLQLRMFSVLVQARKRGSTADFALQDLNEHVCNTTQAQRQCKPAMTCLTQVGEIVLQATLASLKNPFLMQPDAATA